MAVIAPHAAASTPAPAPTRWPACAAAAATALCAALVLFELGQKSLWFDEAFSIGIVDRPMGDALWRLANWEVNQSPFYLLLAGWWRVGDSEAFLRVLPAACSILTVPALFVLGRRMFDARVGAVAALLVAVHPLAVQWGQQLRAYSLVLLLVVVATTMLLRALERPYDDRSAALYAVVAALATYSHFYAGLVVGAHAVWLLLRRPVPHRLLVVAGAAYGLLVAPLGWYLLTREGDPLSWVSAETESAVIETARALTGDSYWGVAAYGIAAAVGLWSIASAVRHASRGDRWEPLLPALWLVVPLAVTTLSTATVKPLLEGRFLIVVVPALALLAAVAICRVAAPGGTALLVGLLAASAIGVHQWHTTPGHEDWRGATRIVASATGPGEPVVIEPWGGVFALRYYEDRLDVGRREVLRPEAGDPPAGARLVEVRRIGGDQVPVIDPGYEAWLAEHYELVDEQHVEKLAVRTFERR